MCALIIGKDHVRIMNQWDAFKGEFRAEFFFQKITLYNRALKCQKNPFCFIFNYFFRSEVIEVLR